MIQLTKSKNIAAAKDTLVVLEDPARLRELDLERGDRQYLLEQLNSDANVAVCDVSGHLVMVHRVKATKPGQRLEKARCAGNEMVQKLIAAKREEAQLVSLGADPAIALAVAEGALLGAYEFRKYKTSGSNGSMRKLALVAGEVPPKDVDELIDLCDAVCSARDLVNEPYSFLTATQLSSEIKNLSRNAGFKVQVFDKRQIEALGMGGLLAVNKGSIDPPTFTIMEWKPKGAVNKKPIVLVGKGVVYDTGGLSLKPTGNSMDYMKCDMAGSAAVACAITAVAKQQLPVHVIGLVPATDNRPGEAAYAPGDVIRMHSGLTVENMNSDAEGRIILADALSYGERYDAELVMTIATLTGAAARAIGSYGSVIMGTADEKQFQRLQEAGDHVFERLAPMPFWDEYDEEIKSDVADIKNLGSDLAGQITAGKFLARFTKRPFIHIDIAGTAFLHKRDNYRVKGGTGVGVRLFYEFIKRRAAHK
jgi:leucyl aminopeptidase